MSKVARLGDMLMGPKGPQTIITGSSTVYADGIQVATVGVSDIGPNGQGSIVIGSSTVFADGKAIARVGDQDSLTCTVIIGSSTVEAA